MNKISRKNNKASRVRKTLLAFLLIFLISICMLGIATTFAISKSIDAQVQWAADMQLGRQVEVDVSDE